MSENTIDLNSYTPETQCLASRTILITGASDGLGKATALLLAKHGATVVLSGKSVKKLEQVYDQIEQAGAPPPVLFPMDLEKAQENDYQQMAHAIDENFGKLDGLILSAVTLGQHSPVTHIDMSQWTRSLQINLTANFLFLKHCAGILNSAEQASVIYLSDALVHQGKAYWTTYAACKAACVNMMQTVADEWEANTRIHINSLDPGVLQTGLRRQAYPGEDPRKNPDAKTAATALLYLQDPGQNWPRGKQLTWDLAAQKLTEN